MARSGTTASARRVRVADELVALLVEHGVRYVFCCPGSTEAAFLDALVGRADLELVLVTHESIAVAAAEGFARRTGVPAVAYLHANVGMANAVAHLISAGLAHAPVLILNGMKASALPGRDGFTTSGYARDAVRQHVKHAWVAESPAAVREQVGRGLRLSATEPCGPVWIGLPQDVLESDSTSGPAGAPPASPLPGLRPDAADVTAAAARLSAAHRPLLVAGSEVGRHGAGARVLRLAERLGAPVLQEARRDFQRTAVPSTDPRVFGGYAPDDPMVVQADVIFFVGCRLFTEFEPTTAPEIPPGAVRIHSHVDPAEIGRLHRVDVALCGTSSAVLDDLLAALPDSARRPSWFTAPDDNPARPPARFPGHRRLAEVVREIAAGLQGHETTVVLDATTATGPLLAGLPQTRTDHLHSSTSGSLGWGMGAALGISLADPGRPVVVLLGDGVFQFGIQALWTAARYRLPVVFVVLNNGAYSAVASALHRFDGSARASDEWPGVDIGGPDIAAIARGYGVRSVQVAGPSGVAAAVRDALATAEGGAPALIEILTSAEDPDDRGTRVSAEGGQTWRD